VQNFAAIGPRSSEITRGEKRNHSKTEVLPKTIVFVRTNNKRPPEHVWQPQTAPTDSYRTLKGSMPWYIFGTFLGFYMETFNAASNGTF